ncbi:glucans biosynthesis glucosyltransferase MdoH [Caenispirillum bisanense]|uniref:Glucans biosynthesis glucosyltransferase H n=1 Tax=Caenispirillum bisanense TaxID=414052 RepID=A0A286H1T0_9PROT|nr:glucans biosynthesis glucosyltransferase MdoH [Caenispirillum bisanense]SOE01733.1 membrane glycosyltransferase [Caenispirillum bisanense]
MGRRTVFVVGVLGTAAALVASYTRILFVDGLSLLDIALIAVFVPLALWLAQSFWTLGAGFLVLLLRGPAPAEPPVPAVTAKGPTAVVVPVYNEEVGRVFAGIQAMRHDLARHGLGEHFHVHVLSDSTKPGPWLSEVNAWRDLADGADEVRGMPPVYYRRRLQNRERKAGNIADFVRRHGQLYEYMVVLDADSIMTASSLARLVARMEADPQAGLVQAPPRLARGETFFARVLQFAGAVYGPLSAAGIAFWAAGEGNYWGHNAIIRTRAFSDCCGLPHLPGAAPLGGEILSHDFVEAALLRRGGWKVLIADDIDDTLEEPPPTVGDFATRDRRWCQGNLQHARLIPARGLHWVSRLHFSVGVMSYVSSALWLVFLVLSALQAWQLARTPVSYFADGRPFPQWPLDVQGAALALLAVAMGLLLVPKLFGLLLTLRDGRLRRSLGGGGRVTLGVLIETVYTALLAPIMMLLHALAVFSTMLGKAVGWSAQNRTASEGAFEAHLERWLPFTAIGTAATAGAWVTSPTLALWLSPVEAGLILAPLVVWLGDSRRLGLALRRARLLLTREETQPSPVLQTLDRLMLEEDQSTRPGRTELLAWTVLDADRLRDHLDLLPLAGQESRASAEDAAAAARKLRYLGPASLSDAEALAVLEHAEALQGLHAACWTRSLAGDWPDAPPLPPRPDTHKLAG